MAYFARRLGVSVLIVYVVATISFFLIRLMPGNAMLYMYYQLLNSHTVSAAQALEQVKALYAVNLHQPLFLQYLQYLGDLLRGRLGNSILYPGTSVARIIANAIPWTVLSVTVALLLSFVVGISAGTMMAYLRKRRISTVITALMTVLNAVPNYIVALFLLYWLAYLHHIFPTGGAFSPEVSPGWNAAFLISVARHAALPIIAYVITSMGGWALGMKSSVVGTLGEEHITAAHARGLNHGRIARSYVARTAILPLATSLGLSIGFMFGGSVFIESLFNYPGIGYYLITAVNGRDYPLMMGAFILTATSVVLANLFTDLVNRRLDPRLR